MYEQMRSQYLTALKRCGLQMDAIRKATQCLDMVMSGYEVSGKSEALAEYNYAEPALIEEYFASKLFSNQSESTCKMQKYVLDRFLRSTGLAVGAVTANDVRNYLYLYKRQNDIENVTLELYRSVLHSFFAWCVSRKYLAENPVEDVEKIRVEIHEREALNGGEYERLLSACNTEKERALIAFLKSTGCRVSECAGIKLSDIDWYKSQVHVRQGKGKKDRTVFLDAAATVRVQDWLKYRNDREIKSEYLFTSDKAPYSPMTKDSIEYMVKKIAGRTDIGKNITPHVLRHTMATQMLENGANAASIQQILGHSRLDTTMIYAKLSVTSAQAEFNRCMG